MKCEKCGQEIPENKGIKIVSRYDSEKVLFQSSKETMKEAVVEAARKKVDLRDSYLSGSDLRGSDLRGSYLSGSDLSDSDLRDSDLRDSDLRGSNLSDSNLRDSDLRGSNLSDSNLRDSDLRGTKTTMCKVNFSNSEYTQAKQFIAGLK